MVARAAGRSLPQYAREQLFEPLGMTATRYWPGPEAYPPGAVPADPAYPAALSLGDGGVWSTARDLMRWSAALDADELGVSALVQTPGRLDDGTALDYAWGMDVGEHAGRPVHRHGGTWVGLCAHLVRAGGDGFVVLALDEDEDRTTRLAAALLDDLTA